MAHEAVIGFELPKISVRGPWVEDIFPYRLARAAMRQGEVVDARLAWQVFQERGAALAQHVLGPSRGRACVVVETGELRHTEGCLIVIADEAHKSWKRLNEFDTLVWIRTVTDCVAEAPDRLIGRRPAPGVLKYRLEGGEIGMDVGQNENAHAVNFSMETTQWEVGCRGCIMRPAPCPSLTHGA